MRLENPETILNAEKNDLRSFYKIFCVRRKWSWIRLAPVPVTEIVVPGKKHICIYNISSDENSMIYAGVRISSFRGGIMSIDK